MISWLGIWGIICWQGLVHCVSFFRSGQTSELGIRIALIACIFCFLIEAFFEFPTRSPCAMFVGWSALGVLLGLNLSKPTGKSVPETSDLRGKPVFNLAIGVVGVVLPIYAFFLVKDLFWANVFHYQDVRLQMKKNLNSVYIFIVRQYRLHLGTTVQEKLKAIC